MMLARVLLEVYKTRSALFATPLFQEAVLMVGKTPNMLPLALEVPVPMTMPEAEMLVLKVMEQRNEASANAAALHKKLLAANAKLHKINLLMKGE